MPYTEDDLQTAVQMTIDHVLNKRGGPPLIAPLVAPAVVTASASPMGNVLDKMFSVAPGWITLLVAAVIGYASLNTRVSTVEYQNTISITDRADLRQRVDKTDTTLNSVDKHLGEIDVTLKELANRSARSLGRNNEAHDEN